MEETNQAFRKLVGLPFGDLGHVLDDSWDETMVPDWNAVAMGFDVAVALEGRFFDSYNPAANVPTQLVIQCAAALLEKAREGIKIVAEFDRMIQAWVEQLTLLQSAPAPPTSDQLRRLVDEAADKADDISELELQIRRARRTGSPNLAELESRRNELLKQSYRNLVEPESKVVIPYEVRFRVLETRRVFYCLTLSDPFSI